jgi:hypothetical protein
MKAYWGSEGITPRIIDLGIDGGEWSASRIGRFTTPGKEPLVPLDRRLSGPQSRSGRGGEEKNSQPLLGLEPPIIQPVAQRYTTEMSRILSIDGDVWQLHYIFLLAKSLKLSSWIKVWETNRFIWPCTPYSALHSNVNKSQETVDTITVSRTP